MVSAPTSTPSHDAAERPAAGAPPSGVTGGGTRAAAGVGPPGCGAASSSAGRRRGEESSHGDRHHAVTSGGRSAPARPPARSIGRPRAASVIACRARRCGPRVRFRARGANVRSGCAGTMADGAPGGRRRRHGPGDAGRPGRMRFQDETHHPARAHPGRAHGPRAGRSAASRRSEQRRTAEPQRSRTKRKRILVGAGVTVGVVALIAVGYAVAQPDEEVQAQCVDDERAWSSTTPTASPRVDGTSTYGGGAAFFPIFIGAGGRQYHYNYGGTGTARRPGQRGHHRPCPRTAPGCARRPARDEHRRFGRPEGSGSVSRGGLGSASRQSSGSSGRSSSSGG